MQQVQNRHKGVLGASVLDFHKIGPKMSTSELQTHAWCAADNLMLAIELCASDGDSI
jgi:hypothetical protein